MLNRNEVLHDIEEKMKTLSSSDVCALFLLSVEKRDETCEELNLDSIAEQTSNVFSRFFRINDIVGYIGKNKFAAFLTGKPTEGVIWEKASTLTETLWLAAENLPEGSFSNYVGVYVFRANNEEFKNIFSKAEYALEMAHKSKIRNFYIYTTSQTDAVFFHSPADSFSSQMFENYIDEAVRILEVRETIRPVYISPDYYRRLSIEEGDEDLVQLTIHPQDKSSFDSDVMEVVKSGKQKESAYRVSKDESDWVQCRSNLLRLRQDQEHTLVLEISHDTTGLEQLKRKYEEKDQWCDFISKKTNFQLWEVDISTLTLSIIYRKEQVEERQSVFPNFPESLIECGRIHHDSADAFREFAHEIVNGKSKGAGNFIAQSVYTSSYGWISVSYKMMYDKEDRPEKALGVSEDLSYFPTKQAKFVHRRNIPTDLYSNLYCFMQANLTANYIERLLLEGHEKVDLTQYKSYSEILKVSMERLFSVEDGKRFLQIFYRNKLLADFEKGKRWFYERCQLTDNEGNIQWISIGVNLCKDHENSDVCLFAYMNNRNLQQRWETEVDYMPSENPDSELYPPATAKMMMKKFFKGGERTLCAFAEINVIGLEELIEEEDRAPVDLIRQNIATALHTFLNTDCIIWKKNRDSLCVFFPSVVSKSSLRRRIENAFIHTRVSLDDIEGMHYIRFVAGVSCASLGTADYIRMENIAGTICSMHTTEPSDAVVFGDDDSGWNDKILSEMANKNLIFSAPNTPAPLSEEDKDVAMDCLSLMLVNDGKDNSLSSVLERLGRYYDADRVYVLALTENKQIITMLNEWYAKGKHEIQGSISGKRVSQFPVIARYARNPGPLVLSKTDPSKTMIPAISDTPWQYMLFPMGHRNDTEFIFCVENSKKNSNRIALIEKLIPYIAQEERRFTVKQQSPENMNKLYTLNASKAYEKVVSAMNSDCYRSMGAMTVNISEFSALKDREGYEYANQFLLKIAEVLLTVFGQDHLFHTKEEEFIVLCTDTTYRVFLNQCVRAKQLVGKRYNKLFRIGCAWSDGIFNGTDIVTKAKSIMMSTSPTNLSIKDFYSNADSLKDSILKNETQQQENGRKFTIYLQPKVDIRTGKLIGAEALVRVLDDEGNLLPHGPIIDEMEKEGTIPKLDFFVFDRALYTLSQWKQKGYDIKPISSNFSRNTLLNPSALASTLATLSRYPNVSPDLIELEITETAGSVETSTFSDLIQRFGDYGIQFSLDDFGSSYSNISMLSDLRFHSVKLDRSIVRNISSNSVTRMMVRDIARICKSYDMLCVAEGVETQMQAAILIKDECFYAQGYYYGKPMPVEEFENKYFRPKY